MKYLKQKEKKKTGKYTVAIVLLICMLFAAAAVLLFMKPDAGSFTDDETTGTETTVRGTSEVAVEVYGKNTIDTPYGTIKISDQWINNLCLKVTDDGCYTLEFAALLRDTLVPLFDIHFNTVSGNFLGYVTSKTGEQVRASADIYEIVPGEDWNKDEQSLVFGMQDELNNILLQLSPENSVDYLATATVSVSTAYGDLCYPAVWKDYLRTEVSDNVVSFYGKVEGKEEIRLFDFVVGGNGEKEVGSFRQGNGNTVAVYLVTYDFEPNETWSEKEIELIYGMQDVASFVIARLSMDNESTALKPAAEMVTVKTSYGTISYSGMWGSGLRTEIQNNVISFFGAVQGHSEIRLFDIVLGGSGETLVGQLDGNTKVYVNRYDFTPDNSWTQEQINTIHGMQDIMNDIVDQLTPVESTDQAMTDGETVTVETVHGSLQYPNIWGEKLYTEVRNNVILFYGRLQGKESIHLFDVSIGGTGELEAGVLTKNNGDSAIVYITSYNFVPTAAWSDDEVNTIYGMYDIMNDIMSQLMPVEKESEAFDDIVIDTSFADLNYPGRWRDCLRTEITDYNGCTVRFYSKIAGKGEVHLFDIVIGTAGDHYVGLLTGENGKTAEVYMNYYEVNVSNSWTEDEVNQVYAMQEDMNYIFDKWIETNIFAS